MKNKLFVLYAYTIDGTRQFLWARMLPADFDWQAWQASRQDAMKILGVSRFSVEVIDV